MTFRESHERLVADLVAIHRAQLRLLNEQPIHQGKKEKILATWEELMSFTQVEFDLGTTLALYGHKLDDFGDAQYSYLVAVAKKANSETFRHRVPIRFWTEAVRIVLEPRLQEPDAISEAIWRTVLLCPAFKVALINCGQFQPAHKKSVIQWENGSYRPNLVVSRYFGNDERAFESDHKRLTQVMLRTVLEEVRNHCLFG